MYKRQTRASRCYIRSCTKDIKIKKLLKELQKSKWSNSLVRLVGGKQIWRNKIVRLNLGGAYGGVWRLVTWHAPPSPPPHQLGGGGLKNSEKSLLEGDQKFLFLWGRGYIAGGRDKFVGSCNFEVKIKTA